MARKGGGESDAEEDGRRRTGAKAGPMGATRAAESGEARELARMERRGE